jgi:hypothetical protein
VTVPDSQVLVPDTWPNDRCLGAPFPWEENRVLKEALQGATGKRRIPLSDEQRRRLATKGKALTPTEREV